MQGGCWRAVRARSTLEWLMTCLQQRRHWQRRCCCLQPVCIQYAAILPSSPVAAPQSQYDVRARGVGPAARMHSGAAVSIHTASCLSWVHWCWVSPWMCAAGSTACSRCSTRQQIIRCGALSAPQSGGAVTAGGSGAAQLGTQRDAAVQCHFPGTLQHACTACE